MTVAKKAPAKKAPAPKPPAKKTAPPPKKTAPPPAKKTTPPPKPPPTGNPATQGAMEQLKNDLNLYGLGALGTQLWQEWLKGTSIDQILMDMRASDTYKQRFSGMAQLISAGHAITEADYIAKEAADSALLRAYGMTGLSTDRQFLGSLIGGAVSTNELQTRLDLYHNTVQQLPPEVRNYLRDQEGVNTGDLMHFWFSPDQALTDIQAKARAAEVGGAAQVAGFGQIDPQMAVHLAGLGLDFGQAMSGFGKAGELRGLTQQLPGQSGSGVVSQDQLVNAELGGDAQAALAVSAAQAQRKAQFGDSNKYAVSQQGVVGLAPTDNP